MSTAQPIADTTASMPMSIEIIRYRIAVGEEPPFLALVRPFIGAVEEMQHYGRTEIAGTGGAAPAP